VNQLCIFVHCDANRATDAPVNCCNETQNRFTGQAENPRVGGSLRPRPPFSETYIVTDGVTCSLRADRVGELQDAVVDGVLVDDLLVQRIVLRIGPWGFVSLLWQQVHFL